MSAAPFSIRAVLKHTSKIDGPGFYKMPDRDYHADPCPTPALSSTLAITVVDQSPQHMKLRAQRLGGEIWESSDAQDLGSAAHAFAFGDPDDVVEVAYDSWRTDAAKKARSLAVMNGKVALLTERVTIAHDMAAIAKPAFEQIMGEGMAELLSEIAIVWQNPAWEGLNHGAWRRTKIDLITDDARVVCDFKTTGQSVEPVQRERHLFDMGYDVQQAMTEAGLDTLYPEGAGRRRFVFLSQEQKLPHAMTAHIIDESSMHDARQKYAYAERAWDKCLHLQRWPSYPPTFHTAISPPWQR